MEIGEDDIALVRGSFADGGEDESSQSKKSMMY